MKNNILFIDNIGKYGERLATQYLIKKGYHILEQNYTVSFGEIDIIAEKKECLCFIEVKCRKTKQYGLPEEAITPEKRKKIIRVAQFFIKKKPLNHAIFRFDVIAIQFDGFQCKEIRHIKNAFIQFS